MKGTARAKALLDLLVRLGKVLEGPCGWNGVIRGRVVGSDVGEAGRHQLVGGLQSQTQDYRCCSDFNRKPPGALSRERLVIYVFERPLCNPCWWV